MPDSKKISHDERVAKYIVAIVSIIGLVIVLWLDLGAEENVPQFVYGIFGGGILGAEVITGWFKK